MNGKTAMTQHEKTIPIYFSIYHPNGRHYYKGARQYTRKQLREYIAKKNAQGFKVATLWVTRYYVTSIEHRDNVLYVVLSYVQWYGAPIGDLHPIELHPANNYRQMTKEARE